MAQSKCFFLRCTLILAAFSFLVDFSAHATQNINTELLSKSVVYIYRGDASGHADVGLPLGTGFLVAVPLLSNPKSGYFLLVTARHVIDPEWNHCPDSQPQVIYVRFNKKHFDPSKDESGVDFAPIQLKVDASKRGHIHRKMALM